MSIKDNSLQDAFYKAQNSCLDYFAMSEFLHITQE